MGETLNKRLHLTRPAGPTQEAVLNLLVAGGVLRDKIDSLFEAAGITGAQYNVLRILRGPSPVASRGVRSRRDWSSALLT